MSLDCSCRACEFNRDQKLKYALMADSADELLASLEAEVQARQEDRQEAERNGVRPPRWVVKIGGNVNSRTLSANECELNADLSSVLINRNAGYLLSWTEKE